MRTGCAASPTARAHASTAASASSPSSASDATRDGRGSTVTSQPARSRSRRAFSSLRHLWAFLFAVGASSRLACSHKFSFTRSSSHYLWLGGSRKDDYGMWVTKMGCYHTGECHGVDSCINCPHGWAGPKCEEVRCLLLPCPAVCSLLLPFAALRLSSSLLSMHIDDHRFKLSSRPRFCPERTLLITLPVLPLTVLSAYVVACCLDQVPGGLAILIIGLVAGLGNLYIYPPLKRTPMCIFSSWV